jgi:hypothetical protein
MIRVVVEIREHALVRRVRITAESIEHALELCEGNDRVVFPIKSEPFYVPKDAAGSVEDHASDWRAKVAA